MRDDVTVIPEDELIAVDGTAYTFKWAPVAGHEAMHALQWHGGKGAIEGKDGTRTEIGSGDYDAKVGPYVQFWETRDKAVKTEEAARKEAYLSPEETGKRVRAMRSMRLAATDYLLQPDYPELTEASMAAVRAYRKALRDLPEQAGFPWTDSTVPWPDEPVITIREQ